MTQTSVFSCNEIPQLSFDSGVMQGILALLRAFAEINKKAVEAIVPDAVKNLSELEDKADWVCLAISFRPLPVIFE